MQLQLTLGGVRHMTCNSSLRKAGTPVKLRCVSRSSLIKSQKTAGTLMLSQ